MNADPDDITTQSIRYYLSRISHILKRVSDEPDPEALLRIKLAPDLFDTGLQFAIAIQFAARALCPPAGIEAPEIPEDYTCETLLKFEREVAELVRSVSPDDLRNEVVHSAGKAELRQEPGDYIVRFAFPNMLFHLSVGYAGLRHGGMAIGKADFDGLHVY